MAGLGGRWSSSGSSAFAVRGLAAGVRAGALPCQTSAVTAVLLLALGTRRLGTILTTCAGALATAAMTAVAELTLRPTATSSRRALGVTRLVAAMRACAIAGATTAVTAVLLLA